MRGTHVSETGSGFFGGLAALCDVDYREGFLDW